MAYQSLYRRYRSQTFGELVGQQHIVSALRNAITEDRVGHAYLFSGPRGTGKTSAARILGKALNCTDLGAGGEPCCACESCLAFEAGTSYDLHELDAASNNGVEAIRDLISKVALASPGRTKVYILDEVHMLTAGAENALLKTLEEPPDHVVFVLATTEPHKVVATIRSRTQHYEFQLIPADELGAHVRFVAKDAGLDIDDAMVDYVLRVGGGSARDTLSALDQVVAAGGIPRDLDAVDVVLQAVATTDPNGVIAAVGEALKSGLDPRVIGENLLARLRDAFLCAMGAPLDHLSEAQAAAAKDVAQQMGPASITRSLELIGTALIAMRNAPDPRVDLEVGLLRLTRADLDTDLAAVVARLERLERGAPPPQLGESESTPAPVAVDRASASVPRGPADGARAQLAGGSNPAPVPATEPEPVLETKQPAPTPGQSGSSRPSLGAQRGTAKPVAAAPDAESPAQSMARAPSNSKSPEDQTQKTADAAAPPLAELEAAWAEVKATLPGRAKSRFNGGRFMESGPAGVVFGLPNAIHRQRCQDCLDDVDAALSDHFGSPVSLTLVVDGDAVAPAVRAPDPVTSKPESTPDAEEAVDMDALTDANPDAAGGVELLTEAFPGAELVDNAENEAG